MWGPVADGSPSDWRDGWGPVAGSLPKTFSARWFSKPGCVFHQISTAIAAKSDSGPCVTYCGRGSAGHFVKMVHNGIEYGDMQLIAETSVLLRRGLGLSASETADVFSEWNTGELESFLVEITA